MIEHAVGQIVKLGGRREGPRAASWEDTLVLLDVGQSGVAELRVELPLEPDDGWWKTLHSNPEFGWTYALTEQGRLQRRDVLAPRLWTSPTELHARLRALVAGVPAQGKASERRRLVRLWDDGSCPPESVSAQAAIAFLLRRNALGLDGSRHRVEGSELESVWQSVLVGQGLDTRRQRTREEAGVVRALRHCADAARALLEQLSLSVV